jgi:UDP-N-acetylmuramoylalanine--D-glutamate ligase
MLLKDKKVMVFGAAISGIAAVNMLQKLGTNVILFDSNTKLTKKDIEDKIDTDKLVLITGSLPEEIIDTIELLIISPGVAFDHPEVVRIKEKNIQVWGEIELAYRFAKGNIIGITGTNGKTTTTTLVGDIMKTYFEEVYVAGNIGKSYSDIALNTSQESVTVIELSSFQLETIQEFKPDISAILNITPDHLDRHYTMDQYIAMKENITKNQTMSDICILNYEDQALRNMAKRLKTRVMFFSSARELQYGLYLKGEDIYYSLGIEKKFVCNVNELRILGKHNYENVMAAVGIAVMMGIPMDYIRKAIIDFQAVEHRIEYVETINGVTYYNDSKGTNPDASIRAVQAMKSPIVLIAGGYDKKTPYDDFIKAFDNKVKYLVLLGQTRELIAETARRYEFHNIIMVNSLREAVRVSADKAAMGDAVLLSPGCASMDMFENYEQRGRLFKEYVREMV